MGIPPLTIANITVLTQMFNQSTVSFQNSRSALIAAEDTKLRILKEARKDGYFTQKSLKNTKKDVDDTKLALISLANEIDKKAAAGTHINKTWY